MYRQYSFIVLVLAASRYRELFPKEVELEHSEPERELCLIEEYDSPGNVSVAFR